MVFARSQPYWEDAENEISVLVPQYEDADSLQASCPGVKEEDH
jgi:hypothetical protein